MKILTHCIFSYLYLFYYETMQRWKEHSEDYGEFPQEIGFELTKLLKKFRPKDKSKFAKSLEQAQAIVVQMQGRYKEQAEELIKQTSMFNTPIMDQDDEQPRGKVSKEEDDEEA